MGIVRSGVRALVAVGLRQRDVKGQNKEGERGGGHKGKLDEPSKQPSI